MKRLFSRVMKDNEKWEHEIITSRKALKEWLKYEKAKYPLRSGSPIPISEQDYIWKYQRCLRKTEYYLNTGKAIRYLISRTRLLRLGIKLGPNIRLNSCGKGVRIAHLSSVITNGDIGMDCTLFPNVLIGQSRGKSPVLGDRIHIFTGAVVVGDIHLANDIIVGANSVVTKSFEEENAVIAGVPAKIISIRSRDI